MPNALTKRIIPCLDVRDGRVVKGIQFRNHQDVGDIVSLAQYYSERHADELVFYDITASSDDRPVEKTWLTAIAQRINIPFCVAGGIRSIAAAEQVLMAGADKFSINSPALENPDFINQCVAAFGSQCVVIGIDSKTISAQYQVCQYTGRETTAQLTRRNTHDWVREVQDRGAGEIVLNCMDQDGVRNGYDIEQLQQIREMTSVPLIASGGAGSMDDFARVFLTANVDGALAASVFHKKEIDIPDLKNFLAQQNIPMRCSNGPN